MSRSLRRLTEGLPTREEMNEGLRRLSDESDYTTVIVGTALVETALRLSIRARMNSALTRVDEQQLFDGDAPLSTFSSKIRVAFAFEVLDAELRDEVNRLRAIRNAFAHSSRVLNFDTTEVANVCRELILPEYDTGAPWEVNGEDVIWSPVKPKDRYLVSVRLSWLFLYQGIHNPPRWVRA